MNKVVRNLRNFNLARLYRVIISLCIGVVATTGSFIAVGFSPAFVATPFSRFLSRYLPDVVIKYAILILGSLGQKLNLITAIMLTVGLFAGIVFGAYKVNERFGRPYFNIPVTSGLLFVASYLLTFDLQSSVGAIIPAAVLLTIVRVVTYIDTDEYDLSGEGEVADSRRSFIIASVGAALFGSVGAREALKSTAPTNLEDNPAKEFLTQAEQKSFDIDGMDALVSEDFYEVDINSINPDVKADSWSLSVTGQVANTVTIDYEDITEMETVSRFETLRCVGESLNGEKMDTAFWTGTPVMPLLERADIDSGCGCVMVRAEDGYFEEFPVEALEDAILAYRMNGRPLPRGHGAPVRLLVPGHWGEISVKWVDEIEILDKEMDGYWEERGWHGTGPANTVAKLHAENTLENGNKEVGGHAYAGTRGISRVEVSTDGGSTWNEAELTEELEPSIDAWHQWRYEYEPPNETHTVVVRAVEEDGTVQTKEETGRFPSGPSGWVSREIQA